MGNFFLLIWVIFTSICLIWLYFAYINPKVAYATNIKKESDLVAIFIVSLIPVINIIVLIIAVALYLESAYSPLRKLPKGKWFNKDHLE